VPPPDEFAWIDRLRPLTRGDPRALNLMDDAAVLPSRPGYDLVISTDAMLEGVHFLAGEAMDIVARRLLRTSLSDLAAKAAEPFGYFLTTAWPARFDDADRDRFIAGLDEDGRTFGIVLLGGDTVSIEGPLTLSATVLGWTPAGRMVTRGGARAGDLCVVCGTIGNGWLGLRAARGEVDDPGGRLASRHRLPEPLFSLRTALRNHAAAAADVSDGLIADALHIADSSGLGLDIDLTTIPLSAETDAWLTATEDKIASRVELATGGDDYAVVCAVAPHAAADFAAEVLSVGSVATAVGAFDSSGGLSVRHAGRAIDVDRLGWRH
jgi:thiamine-monophosphate kinase